MSKKKQKLIEFLESNAIMIDSLMSKEESKCFNTSVVDYICRTHQLQHSRKPVATEITSWQPYKEILYNCPNCKTSFRFFGAKEKYCHNCGIEIDWAVKLELDEPMKDREQEKYLISEINTIQIGGKRDENK